MLHREFGWTLSEAGLWLGAITIVCSPVGMVAGGKLAEAWARKGRSDANLRIVLYALYVSVPLSIVTSLLPSAPLVLAAYALQMLVTGLGFGPGIASFQLVTPNAMRAQIGSVMQFSANVLAFAAEPADRGAVHRFPVPRSRAAQIFYCPERSGLRPGGHRHRRARHGALPAQL